MDPNTLCPGCMENKGASKTCPHCDLPADIGPESALHLPPGTILQDKYLLGRALGQGGFGITYLAWDLNLNLKLAIKEYLPLDMASRATGQPTISIYKKEHTGNFQYGLEKYLDEARTLARFAGHPNIVWVRDFFKANDTAYIVMEYLEGHTLKEYLQSKQAPLPMEQALPIFMPILDALREVHAEGILHREISPDNILIDKNGRVVLIDFGAARQAVGEQSRSLSVIMKSGFSPEEQYHSKGKQGPWTDIYAVAASLYCVVTGTIPTESLSRLSEDTLEAPSKLGIEIDPLIEQALLKAMAVRAKDRYQTIDEFQEELLGDEGKPGTFSTSEHKSCPYCGEEVSVKAIKCRYCQSMLDDEIITSKTVVTDTKNSLSDKAPSQAKGNRTLANKKVIGFIAAFIIIGLLIFGGISLLGNEDDLANTVAPTIGETVKAVDKGIEDIYDFPENNKAMADVLAIVTELGVRLNAEGGYYGDLHDAIVEAGNRQNPEHDLLYSIFNEWLYEIGATYLYSFIDDGGDNVLIIVDGAEPGDMDPYGHAYPKEPWTVKAFRTGKPTVAKTTWMDSYGYGLQKSAFAPIFNSEDEISFLLGIDYPVPQLEAFPEIMD